MNRNLAVLAAALPLQIAALVCSPAWAQTVPVQLECTIASNSCNTYVTSPGSPTPLRYAWSFDTSGTDARFKFDCTNRAVCRFWCPHNEGPILASVTVRDANNQLIGTSASQGTCTQQDIILP